MKKASFVFIAMAAVLLLSPCKPVFAENLKPLVLVDFEKESDMNSFVRDSDKTTDFPTEKVAENATSGKYALKVTFPKEGSWPGLHFVKFKHDWSKYDLLKVDIYNPQKSVIQINFGCADDEAGFTKENYFGEYGKRFGASSILKPGKNTFEVDLSGATVEDKSRTVMWNKLKRFAIFVMERPDPCVLYFDNIRLEKSEE